MESGLTEGVIIQAFSNYFLRLRRRDGYSLTFQQDLLSPIIRDLGQVDAMKKFKDTDCHLSLSYVT